MTALEREWEARLAADGMPVKLPRARGQASGAAVTYHNSQPYADSPRLNRWLSLTHAANALPSYFHNRHLLITLCELGYVSKTAEKHGVSQRTVFRALAALERQIQHAK